MEPLFINLVIIFGLRLTLANLIEMATPIVMGTLRRRTETEGIEAGRKLTQPEEDYILMPFSPAIENIKNYADSAVQFGFMMLFVTALPMAPFLAMLNNYAKVKFEVWKMIVMYQRSPPIAAQDIGNWQNIFTTIAVISVITNAALLAFTMNLLDRYQVQSRMWVFIGFQWVLIAIQVR
jgi:hypothetical protein